MRSIFAPIVRQVLRAATKGAGIVAITAALVQGQTENQQPGSDYCNSLLGGLSQECQSRSVPLAPIGQEGRSVGTGMPGAQGGSPQPGRNSPAPQPPPLVPGADAPNEFQRFAANSVGSILPIFGTSLFQRVPTTFAPVDKAPVTADYVIGPGDGIVLRVWGQVNLNLELVVDRTGSIYVPQAGNLSVSGLQYKQLPEFLKSKLGRVFRNFDLTVSMGQLRSIQVFVIGQARRPGAYTVSSLSTLVNALFASGGPTAQGSMRHIQLKRGDAVVSDLDLYDLLLKGDKSKDAPLLPGDVVFIPSAGPQVALAGSVRNPGVFELKDERTVGEALQLAGGLTPTSDLKRVLLERISAEHRREVLEISLDAVGRAVAIREADVVSIRSLSPHFERTVTLRGNVASPGRFAWREGMKLRDIIPDKDSLVTRAYWEKKNYLGFQPAQNRPAQTTRGSGKNGQGESGFDSPGALSQNADRGAQIDGETTSDYAPSDRPAGAKEDTKTELVVSGGEINWAYAVIERQDPDRLTAQLIPFNLGKLVLEKDESQNYELRSSDVVTIFSTADYHVPLAQQSRFIRLEGEFNASGIYLAKPNETLGQIIERAGGLTPQAYLYGAEFMRESTKKEQQKRLDQFVQEMESELDQAAGKRNSLTSSSEEALALASQVQSERKAADQLRSMQATGRIVLNFDPGDATLGKLMSLTLEDGDRFVVPSRPATVNVLGEVYNQNAFLHEPRMRVGDYLKGAGGVKRSADKAHIFIIRADGSVLPKHSSGPFSKVFEAELLNPGDSIVVPEEVLKVPFVKSLRQWTQVVADLGLGAAAINVLK